MKAYTFILKDSENIIPNVYLRAKCLSMTKEVTFRCKKVLIYASYDHKRRQELVRSKALDVFFTKIKKFSILPQSPLIPEGIEEGSKLEFLKNMKNHIIHTSSMLLKTDSMWGPIIMKCSNCKSLGSQLSNARFFESFAQKFENLSN